MQDDVKEFIKETKFCDFSNTNIKKLAEEISKVCKSDKEIAISSFYWVRDNILYRVGNWQMKASVTLKEGEGTCTNKANLLVALLRANNIPSGYGIMKVYGQRYFGPIAIPMLRKFIGKNSVHSYASIFLDNKWIKCDPSDDKEFAENTYYFNYTTAVVDWDGSKDAIINFKREDIIEEKYPVANIDEWMIKKSKNAKGIPLKIANIYVKFARKNKIKISSSEELELLFKKYLVKNHFIYFCLFMLASFLKDAQQKIFSK